MQVPDQLSANVMVAASPDAMLLIDHDGSILALHIPEHADTQHPFGLSKVPEIGMLVIDVMPQQIAANIQDRILCFDGTYGTDIAAEVFDYRSGNHYFQLRLVPAEHQGILIVISDVTERKQTELRLAKAQVRARASVRAKNEFLAHISHDIRTPMTSALTSMELLMAERLNDHQRSLIDIAYSSARGQLRLLDDILSLARLESGDFPIESEPLRIADSIEEVRNALSYQANIRNLSLLTDLDGNAAQVVLGDPVRLRQILYNLTNNALKFTSEGSVRILCRCQVNSGTLAAEIQVVDTGSGIAASDVERLFEPFQRIEGGSVGRAAGFGLGLSICRHLAQRMGGDISVQSQLDVGSTFTVNVDFPLAEAGQEPQEAMAMQQGESGNALNRELCLRGAKVLLVEDDPAIAQVCEHLLRSLDVAELATAHDGLEAVQMAGQRAFDLILMDCNLPLLDGRKATEHIRNDVNSINILTPIVALTALASERDREKCFRSGMSAYLRKPFSRDELLGCVASLGHLTALDEAEVIDAVEQEIDTTALEQTIELLGDADSGFAMISDLVKALRKDGPQLCREMIASDDHETIRRLAHRLKSRCALLGLERPREIALSLEEDPEQGIERVDMIRELQDAMQNGVGMVAQWLESQQAGDSIAAVASEA